MDIIAYSTVVFSFEGSDLSSKGQVHRRCARYFLILLVTFSFYGPSLVQRYRPMEELKILIS